jgi:hypothetical protein
VCASEAKGKKVDIDQDGTVDPAAAARAAAVAAQILTRTRRGRARPTAVAR